MTPRKVEFHEEASEEYLAAFEWYFERSESVATRFMLEVSRAIGLIADAHHRWPEYESGFRKFVLRRFPFVAVYRELSSAIQVLAIAHSRRRPGYWKSRKQ
jgi:plasmid stabilization system protein ParE